MFFMSGWCVWVTGLLGSGKSVVSQALHKLFKQKGIHTQLLSSDALRKILTPKPTYSLEERDTVYQTLPLNTPKSSPVKKFIFSAKQQEVHYSPIRR